MPRNRAFKPASLSQSLASAEAEVAALTAGRLNRSRVRAVDIPIARIRPNPFQARQTFEGLEELAAAIRAHGFTSRIRVRHDPSDERYYQLVYGERRLRAAELAGLAELPCDVGEYSDEDLLEVGPMENIQREDLDPLEEAWAFRTFITERGYTQQRLADRIGKDINYVGRRLKLLETPDDVQRMVAQRSDTVMAALEIARLPTPELRQPLIEQVIKGKMTKREVETRVREAAGISASLEDGTQQGAETVERQTGGQAGTADQRPQPEPVPGAIMLSLERDMRTVRRIFSGWNRDVAHLDHERSQHLMTFIEDHLQEVQRLMDRIEGNR